MSRPKKEFYEYLTTSTNSYVGHNDYKISPGTAFLKYTIEAKDAIELCTKFLPKKNDNKTFTKDGNDSLQYVINAVLPTIMSHFETYERYLFAGIFDYSVYLKEFDVDEFFKKLNDACKFNINMVMLAAYRDGGSLSIGGLLSDSLNNWHNTEKVNKYFNAFGLGYQLLSNDDCQKLNVLWQLRHSIVHTGGTLTLSDAQKVDELKPFGTKQIAFKRNFILEISRKMHPIVKRSTEGFGSAFINNIKGNIDLEKLKEIEIFFKVASSINAWWNA